MKVKTHGRTGLRQFGGNIYEEFISDLRGANGIEVFKEMEMDDTCGAILYAIDILCRQVDWIVNPAGDTEDDKKAAQFINECIYDMSDTWANNISEILTFLIYGWSWLEILYKRRNGNKGDFKSNYDDGLIGWAAWDIRSQETLQNWEFDEYDRVIGMTQNVDGVTYTIPRDKSLHFRTKSRKGNPEGVSIFRNAYKAFYFKKRIQELEGIGVERDLAGLPMITAPEGVDIWNAEDDNVTAYRIYAETLVRNVRRDATEGVVMPNGWEFKLLSSGGSRNFDTGAVIERYDKRIAMTVLADFMLLGQDGSGSYAMATNKSEIFMKSLKTYLDGIEDEINKQAIPKLIDLNKDHFIGITDYPTIDHGDLTTQSMQEVGTFLKDMVSSGVLTPDEGIEDFVRSIGKLPERPDAAFNETLVTVDGEDQTEVEVYKQIEKIFAEEGEADE